MTLVIHGDCLTLGPIGENSHHILPLNWQKSGRVWTDAQTDRAKRVDMYVVCAASHFTHLTSCTDAARVIPHERWCKNQCMSP